MEFKSIVDWASPNFSSRTQFLSKDFIVYNPAHHLLGVKFKVIFFSFHLVE